MSTTNAAQLVFNRTLRRSQGLAQKAAELEPWLITPLILAGLAQPRMLGAALAVAAGFWLVRWLAWGRLTVRTPGDAAIVALLLLLPVTLWVTALPEVTRQQTQWLLSGIALYYVIANWARSFNRERGLVNGLVAVGMLAALVAPFAVVWVTDIKLTFIPEAVYSRLPLLFSVPIHPNVLAGALVLAWPIPLALLMFGAAGMERRERVVAALAVAGIALMLFLTKSRGAMLGGSAAMLALCLLRWRRSWMVMVVAAMLAGLAAWAIGFERVVTQLAASGSTVGLPGRYEIWSRAVYLVRDFPFTGIGMGTFRQVSNALYPYFLLGPNADVPHAHNLFLQVAVDLGLPGLVAWLGLFLACAVSAWRVMRAGRRVGDGWSTGLGAGLLAAQLALVVHGMLDAAVWGAHSGIVVWLLWGVCAGAYNLRRGAQSEAQRASQDSLNLMGE